MKSEAEGNSFLQNLSSHHWLHDAMSAKLLLGFLRSWSSIIPQYPGQEARGQIVKMIDIDGLPIYCGSRSCVQPTTAKTIHHTINARSIRIIDTQITFDVPTLDTKKSVANLLTLVSPSSNTLLSAGSSGDISPFQCTAASMRSANPSHPHVLCFL